MGKGSNPFAELLGVAREVSFMKGAERVRQGESSRGCFLIRSGAAVARVALPGDGRLCSARTGLPRFATPYSSISEP